MLFRSSLDLILKSLQPITSIKSYLTFDSSKLKVESIDYTNNIFSYWWENTFDNKTGVYKVVPETYTANIVSYIGSNSTCILDSEVNISMGFNANVASDITSKYTIDGTANSHVVTLTSGGVPKLSTDENGAISGLFNIPANTFKTGERVFKLDNRLVESDPYSATTFSESTFTAGGLSAKTQALNFSASKIGRAHV